MNRVLLALTPLLAIACTASHDPALCLGDTCVAVATSIFNADFTGMGTLNSVELSSRATHVGLDATLDPDITMKIDGEELLVLMRDAGSLRIYDPKTFAVKTELPLGAAKDQSDVDHPLASKSFPQDFWIASDGRIFVTLSGNDAAHALAVVDRNTPGMIQYIALPQDPTDLDGKPEPAALYACNDKLYVTLQSYSVDMNFNVTYAPGRIAILDPASRTVRGVISLTGKNPSDLVALGGSCNDVVVATSSSLTTVPDGSGKLERVDLDAATSRGVLATDEQLGGRPTLLAPVSSDLLYVAMYFDPQPNGMGQVFLSSVKVIAFDPTTKTVLNDVSGKFGNVNFLRRHGDNLFIGAGVYAGMEDPSKSPRGLYIAPADGKPITAPPIDLKLTPSAIAF